MKHWKAALPALALVPALCLPACTARERSSVLSMETSEEPSTAWTTDEEASQTRPWWETAIDEDFAAPQTTLVPKAMLTETDVLQTELPETKTTAVLTKAPSTTAAASATKPATTATTAAQTTTAKTAAAISETVSTKEETKTVHSTTATTTEKPTTAAETTASTTLTTKATTVQPASSTASKAKSTGNARDDINGAALHPMTTGNKELDDKVQKILSSITTPRMTNYEKVKAIYDYIIGHVEYGRNSLNRSDELYAYVTQKDAVIVLSSLDTLKEGVGVCDDYAALFLVMTRAVGLDCWYTTGYTTNTKGEKREHSWNTITAGGVEYLFDAQVEDKQSANGIQYTFFAKTYNAPIVQKVYSGYDHAASKASFGYFKRK